MAKFKRNPFQRPIPGQSLTVEKGSRPWEKPPRFPNPDDAMEYFMDKLTQPKNAARVFALLEQGAEVETITSPIIMAGFVEGMYSPDVAMLIAGPLAGFVKVMGEDQGINVKSRSDNPARDLSLAKLVDKDEPMGTEPVQMMSEGTDTQGGLMGMPMTDPEEDIEDVD